MFSLGSEGLNIRLPRVALPSAVFTCLLVCVLYSDNCRGYVSFKGSSELTPCVLMITWASGWRVSKLCIRPCRNRSWRLPLRALRHRMWKMPNMLTIYGVRWRNPLHILVIVSGSGQMRIWTRISKSLWKCTFPVDSRPIRFEYIAHCILTAYTANWDDASSYNSRLSSAHKARVTLGSNTTVTVNDDFSQTEMMRGLCAASRAASLQDRGAKAWWGDGKWL